MKLTIPIYIEERPIPGEPIPHYIVRPLFFRDPEKRSESINRAVTKLAGELRDIIGRLGTELRHDQVTLYNFSPDVEDHLFKFRLELKKQHVQCNLLLATFKLFNRTLAFFPTIPDIWFEILKGETIFDRANEVLTDYFKNADKRDGSYSPTAESLSLPGKAWTTTLDIDVSIKMVGRPVEKSLFAFLGGNEQINGANELNRVGRCLDWMYPEDLDRVVYRDKEVSELYKLLKSSDNRPVLLIGQRMVGKTAIIHEVVYRRVDKRKAKHSNKETTWLLSPQRLISGMSYVGQWENRLLAIINESKDTDRILYFDDLLGLYQAGVSSNSSLNVANVLKPYIERREFRMLAEITPEAFRVFQEKDRSFADLFHIIRVNEPTEDETLQILISSMQRLEEQYHCQFDLDVLPTVIDLQRRYIRDAVFPGKASIFMKRLGVKYRNAQINREKVLEEFQAKSGLSVAFLDERVELKRKDVIEALSKEVIGQAAALHAAVDAVCIAKARINDPTRPIASFLFLGPTGVGKTQCAKSLAGYLFGSPDKIIRFDMNEFLTASSVSRLIGSFNQPEGLLTSAVRRDPFSIVLLDEIEKADPNIFNLLLQIMGDGRLTDALGRTVDFTNTIIIMTSNLGVREAASTLGFRHGDTADDSVYTQAAERFFKPEIFNRIDRIIPFERLRREDVQVIAESLIKELFMREGLLRRKCVLQIEEEAMEKIVDQGYHPQFGARALKRAIEKELTLPIASQLAMMSPQSPTVINLYSTDNGINVHLHELLLSKPVNILSNDNDYILDYVEEIINEADDYLKTLHDGSEVISSNLQPEQYLYYFMREQFKRVERMYNWIVDKMEKSASPVIRSLQSSSKIKSRYSLRRSKDDYQSSIFTQDMHNYMQALAHNTETYGEKLEDQLSDLLRETALMKAMIDGKQEEFIISVGTLNLHQQKQCTLLFKLYRKLFSSMLGIETSIIENDDDRDGLLLSIKGSYALPLALVEEGIHLFYPSNENFVPVYVKVLRESQQQYSSSMEVVRIYAEHGTTLDVRSGLVSLGIPDINELRTFILTAVASNWR
jgi:ATP-dependent Clp protease ATP-binding subunit ClpC